MGWLGEMKKKIKKVIRPHKGGRTIQLHGRFTPEEAKLIALALNGQSFSDFVVAMAKLKTGNL